ncbi:Retrovirus-related Pol polyprotein from transposon TNT 1-94 [Vitis vinifera]|uniref:Retrovirus-related Pol polyprotein from transposon TNT 1-94 n=1 Tax=Vitis vinifera TaxID=29760 RepID=A0A438IUR6_VITVI|nr:Retrovirus-related Pol polyprotein from transposon TNT 1-94 [Vitis vinifera]
MAIVAHFDLELHQMDVKTAFLNGDLDEDMYMEQPTDLLKRQLVKGDKFSKAQCPQNDDKREEIRTVPYSFVVGSLMYAQVCTRLDIAFVVGMLGWYLSNPRSQHWKVAKKVLRYLQGTKDLMLTYQWYQLT